MSQSISLQENKIYAESIPAQAENAIKDRFDESNTGHRIFGSKVFEMKLEPFGAVRAGLKAGGYFQSYVDPDGSLLALYWTEESGAHWIYGKIFQKYKELGGDESDLGYPISDELPLPGVAQGRYNQFQNGYIAWRPDGGAEKFNSLSQAQEKFGQESSGLSEYIVRIAGLVVDKTRNPNSDEVRVGLVAEADHESIPLSASKYVGEVASGAEPSITLDVGPFKPKHSLSFSFVVFNTDVGAATTIDCAQYLFDLGIFSSANVAESNLPERCHGIVAAAHHEFKLEEIVERTSGEKRDSVNIPPDFHIQQLGGGRMGLSMPYHYTDSIGPVRDHMVSSYWVLWQIVKVQ
jgi:hypothetical protein